MAAPSVFKRVLVHFQKSPDLPPNQLSFTQSIVSLLKDEKKHEKNKATIAVKMDGRILVIGPPDAGLPDMQVICMKKPSFCPVTHLKEEDILKLPEDVKQRGIDVGSVAIVQSADDKVLMIRRPKTMRSFPGIWVPPGGHVEENENLEMAALRELHEETGLQVTQDMCSNPRVLCAWESVFPPKLTAGLPKRHHAVFYILLQLKQPFTAKHTTNYLKPDPREVSALAWLDRELVLATVESEEESSNYGKSSSLPATFSALGVANDGSVVPSSISTEVLVNKCTGDKEDIERVSSGTKHALSEWMKNV